MEAMTWKQLGEAERKELEALLRSPTDAFLSDYREAVGWWLLIIVACVAGAGAAVWDLATESLSLGDYLEILSSNPGFIATKPSILGLVVALIVGAWTATKCLRSFGRRGFAALERAIVVVRGPKLKVARYDSIASMSQTSGGHRRRRCFTVLTLKLKDGTVTELNVTGRWADLASARFEHAT